MNYLILKKKLLYKKIYFFKNFIKKNDKISIYKLKKYIHFKKNKSILRKNIKFIIDNIKKNKNNNKEKNNHIEKNEIEKNEIEKNELEKNEIEKNEIEKNGIEKNEIEKNEIEKNEIETQIDNNQIEVEIENNNIIAEEDLKKYIIKFCVFLGREKNIRILHTYIELLLKNNIIDQYLMFDFSKLINDHIFIMKEYLRLSEIYKERIFLYNYEENNIYKNNNIKKIDWSPFYKEISKSNDNDIIIKCDDDIIFIDILSLKNAIDDRIKDTVPFLIHSNCINNGVCAYYQSDLFPKLKDQLSRYPTGGILGPIFEKPEIAYAMHNNFTSDLLENLENINKYVIDDLYINTRISINFILINGSDTKHLENVSYDDEYLLSGFIPEMLCRPNKIKGDLITSHLSYSFQEKIILNKLDLLNNYSKISEKYQTINRSLVKKYNFNTDLYIPKSITIAKNDSYKIKNWITDNHYYIKNVETNKYLYIDYEEDEFKLSDDKTIFEIYNKNTNIIEIKLGIYYLTRYNSFGKLRNEHILIKYLREDKERDIMKEYEKENDNLNEFYLKFLKYNCYLNINNKCTVVNHNKITKWTFEKVIIDEPYFEATRFIKNNKFYYKNIKTNEIYTNYYKGWGVENILF
jgi:hypothetical protein